METDQDDEEFSETKNRGNVQEAILKIAFYLKKHNMTLREVFEGYIYDEIIEGSEFELLAARVFSEVA